MEHDSNHVVEGSFSITSTETDEGTAAEATVAAHHTLNNQEGSLDILNWLAKAVLENNDDSVEDIAAIPQQTLKSEPVGDEFDLLEYVESSCFDDDGCFDEQKVLDELASFQPKIEPDFSTEVEIMMIDPSSPTYCKSQEIVDYIDTDRALDSSSISASPIFQPDEENEEPNWLSTWDSS